MNAAEWIGQVSAAGPPLSLAARVVQPIALALHELMTNALAHGALAASGGVLEIGWAIENARITLHWRERGGGVPMVPAVEGLGLGLVRGVVERQLGGLVQLDWAPHGLDARLIFPNSGARAANDGRRPSFRSAS